MPIQSKHPPYKALFAPFNKLRWQINTGISVSPSCGIKRWDGEITVLDKNSTAYLSNGISKFPEKISIDVVTSILDYAIKNEDDNVLDVVARIAHRCLQHSDAISTHLKNKFIAGSTKEQDTITRLMCCCAGTVCYPKRDEGDPTTNHCEAKTYNHLFVARAGIFGQYIPPAIDIAEESMKEKNPAVLEAVSIMLKSLSGKSWAASICSLGSNTVQYYDNTGPSYKTRGRAVAIASKLAVTAVDRGETCLHSLHAALNFNYSVDAYSSYYSEEDLLGALIKTTNHSDSRVSDLSQFAMGEFVKYDQFTEITPYLCRSMLEPASTPTAQCGKKQKHILVL